MANRQAARLEGFRECTAALSKLSKGVSRNAGKRSLDAPADVLVREMKVRVSKLTGATEAGIEKGQRRMRRGRPELEVVSRDIASVQLEFGNSRMPADPFARPASEASRGEMLAAFGEALKSETASAVSRAARTGRRGR